MLPVYSEFNRMFILFKTRLKPGLKLPLVLTGLTRLKPALKLVLTKLKPGLKLV